MFSVEIHFLLMLYKKSKFSKIKSFKIFAVIWSFIYYFPKKKKWSNLPWKSKLISKISQACNLLVGLIMEFPTYSRLNCLFNLNMLMSIFFQIGELKCFYISQLKCNKCQSESPKDLCLHTTSPNSANYKVKISINK